MAKLERLGSMAIETLERRLEDGDARVALAVVRGIGFLDGEISSIGPKVQRIAKDQEQAAKSQEFYDQFSW